MAAATNMIAAQSQGLQSRIREPEVLELALREQVEPKRDLLAAVDPGDVQRQIGKHLHQRLANVAGAKQAKLVLLRVDALGQQ